MCREDGEGGEEIVYTTARVRDTFVHGNDSSRQRLVLMKEAFSCLFLTSHGPGEDLFQNLIL